MATAALNRYTPEEYLALERHAEYKSEYIDGRIVAPSGARRPHVVVAINLGREISTALLDSPCEVYSSDMRVRIVDSNRYVYPDLSVSCEPRFDDDHVDVLLNPVLIIEVLSDSTEQYDRGEKIFHYRRIESLREYVLVSQTGPLVETYVREGDFWRYTSVDDLEGTLALASLQVEIPLRRIYAKALLPSEGG